MRRKFRRKPLSNDTKTTLIGIAIFVVGIGGLWAFRHYPENISDIVMLCGSMISGLGLLLGYYSNKPNAQ